MKNLLFAVLIFSACKKEPIFKPVDITNHWIVTVYQTNTLLDYYISPSDFSFIGAVNDSGILAGQKYLIGQELSLDITNGKSCEIHRETTLSSFYFGVSIEKKGGHFGFNSANTTYFDCHVVRDSMQVTLNTNVYMIPL